MACWYAFTCGQITAISADNPLCRQIYIVYADIYCICRYCCILADYLQMQIYLHICSADNLYRQIRKKALSVVLYIICYREKEDFALWLQLTMAMPLLPQNRIEEAWAQLKIFPVDVGHGYKGKFRQLKTYIEKTWVIQRLDVLSVFGSDVRTNNAVESWK